MRRATACSIACRTASPTRSRRCRAGRRRGGAVRRRDRFGSVHRMTHRLAIRASPAPAATCRPTRVTNDDLAARLAQDGIETSDEWIVERTGIRARHFAAPTSPAATSRSTRRGARSRRPAATPSDDRPDHRRDLDARHGVSVDGLPRCSRSSASPAARRSTCRRCAAASSTRSTVADSMIRPAARSKALVVGAEVFSRILDFNDRTTCVLFGDGAGAVVLEASDRARHPRERAARRRQPRRHPLRAGPRVAAAAIIGDAAAADGRPGGVQARGARARRSGARTALAKAGTHRSRHRLADSAPGQHPHHAEHGEEAEAAAREADRHRRPSTATRRPPRSRSRSTTRCAPARSSAATRCMLEGVGGGFTWGAVLLDY